MAWWIVPAVQAAASVLGYATKKKAPKFDNTGYGRELKRIKTQGMYSPQARQKMVGQVSSATGNAAQGQTEQIRGNLIASGMNNSIAGQRLLSAPGQERMRLVSGANERISIANETSKAQAGREYGMAKTQYAEGARQEENQARANLIGGLANAGASAYGAKYKDSMDKQYNTGMDQVQKLMDAGKDDEAENLLITLMARYGNAN